MKILDFLSVILNEKCEPMLHQAWARFHGMLGFRFWKSVKGTLTRDSISACVKEDVQKSGKLYWKCVAVKALNCWMCFDVVSK